MKIPQTPSTLPSLPSLRSGSVSAAARACGSHRSSRFHQRTLNLFVLVVWAAVAGTGASRFTMAMFSFPIAQKPCLSTDVESLFSFSLLFTFLLWVRKVIGPRKLKTQIPKAGRKGTVLLPGQSPNQVRGVEGDRSHGKRSENTTHCSLVFADAAHRFARPVAKAPIPDT